MEVMDFHSFERFLREEDIFSMFGVGRIGVFGSFVRGEEYHDIDLLIESPLDYESRTALKDFLEQRLNIPVDIVMKDYAEPIILHRALKDIRYATAA